MKNIKIGVWLLIGLISSVVQAQNTNLMLWEENLEQLATEAESTDWEDELEELSHRLTQKLNLNTATRQQLEMFPFLSDIQVENLLAYVYVHGDMQTLYELQLVEEMDKATIERLLPFVCVVPSREEEKFPSLKRILKYGKHEATARFDVPFYTRKGYETSYLGPSLYHSLRYNFRYSDRLQMGVTGEKDAGEPFFALHDRQGYDYYSFYLLMKDCGRLQTLAVGNYKASFGQGLALGNSFGFGKTFSLATTETAQKVFASTAHRTNTIILEGWGLPSVWHLVGRHQLSIRIGGWMAWWRMEQSLPSTRQACIVRKARRPRSMPL